MRNKKIIYSAMIGSYDKIQKIKKQPGWDYVMFTDTPVKDLPKNTNWTFKKIDTTKGKNNHFINRWYKMHPHILFPNHEISIYTDANITVNNFNSIEKRIKELEKKNVHIAIPKHYERNCIYKESNRIILSQKDTKENIQKTIKFLREKKYPKKNGLYENNFIYRKHNEKEIIHLMEQWWDFINTHSPRDQMSLGYLLWKNKINPTNFFEPGINTRNHPELTHMIGHINKPTTKKRKIGWIEKQIRKVIAFFIPCRITRHKIRGQI